MAHLDEGLNSILIYEMGNVTNRVLRQRHSVQSPALADPRLRLDICLEFLSEMELALQDFGGAVLSIDIFDSSSIVENRMLGVDTRLLL